MRRLADILLPGEWRHFIEEGVLAHLLSVHAITSTGKIACVIFEPNERVTRVAYALGWNGISPVWELPEDIRVGFAEELRENSDDTHGAAWLAAERPGRIYLLARRGLFLVNFDPRMLDVTALDRAFTCEIYQSDHTLN